jgi:hypothetical protein
MSIDVHRRCIPSHRPRNRFVFPAIHTYLHPQDHIQLDGLCQHKIDNTTAPKPWFLTGFVPRISHRGCRSAQVRTRIALAPPDKSR